MKKKFDCVEMKRIAQRQIRAETRGMSRRQELAHLHEHAAAFWAELVALRKKARSSRKKVVAR